MTRRRPNRPRPRRKPAFRLRRFEFCGWTMACVPPALPEWARSAANLARVNKGPGFINGTRIHRHAPCAAPKSAAQPSIEHACQRSRRAWQSLTSRRPAQPPKCCSSTIASPLTRSHLVWCGLVRLSTVSSTSRGSCTIRACRRISWPLDSVHLWLNGYRNAETSVAPICSGWRLS